MSLTSHQLLLTQKIITLIIVIVIGFIIYFNDIPQPPIWIQVSKLDLNGSNPQNRSIDNHQVHSSKCDSLIIGEGSIVNNNYWNPKYCKVHLYETE